MIPTFQISSAGSQAAGHFQYAIHPHGGKLISCFVIEQHTFAEFCTSRWLTIDKRLFSNLALANTYENVGQLGIGTTPETILIREKRTILIHLACVVRRFPPFSTFFRLEVASLLILG